MNFVAGLVVALVLPTLAPGAAGLVARSFHDGCAQSLRAAEVTARVDVYDTNGSDDAVIAAYAQASARADVVIGPMQKTGVRAALRQYADAPAPTILLQPGRDEAGDIKVGQNYYVLTIDLEEEIKQLARLILSRGYRALVVSADSALAHRQTRAFAAAWDDAARPLRFFDVGDEGDDWQRLFDQLRDEKKARGRDSSAPPLAIFAAGDEKFVRQTRYFTPQGYAVFASSLLYAQTDFEDSIFLESLRVMEMPWFLSPRQWADIETPLIRSRPPLEQRYFALGADACMAAASAAAWADGWMRDGASGALELRGAVFERRGVLAQYRAGELSELGQ